MAATHWLDISLTLDDIGWHFLNFDEPNFVKEIENGLRELELNELAEVFRESYNILQPYIDSIINGEVDYYDLLEQNVRIESLNKKAWELQPEGGIYVSWMKYTRKNPERVFKWFC